MKRAREENIKSVFTSNSTRTSTKRVSNETSKPCSAFDFQNRLEPKTTNELAVHAKKIQEVESWLDWNLMKNPKKSSTFLIMSGPSGCGKTATLRVLCRKLSISIKEWINPLDENYEWGRTQNQAEKFKEFLVGSKYTSLLAPVGSKSVVLVEDFPDFFIRNPLEFGTALDDCYYKCRSPIIFICNESFDKGMNVMQSLFPQELRDKYKMANISFNPCAATIMKTAVNRALNLAQQNRDLFQIPSSSTIEAIISTAMGDIRSAVNQFYFASLLGSCDLPTIKVANTSQTNIKGRKKKPEKNVKQMCRDEYLGLFHGIGRVLNPKKIESGKGLKLNCDVDKLIDEFSTQPNTIVGFLFENYLKYFGDINDIYSASEYLSLSESFLNKWNDRNEISSYALWISVMGLMLSNEHKVSKWNQITGPKKIPQRTINVATLNLAPTDLYYYNLIKKSSKDCFFIKN